MDGWIHIAQAVKPNGMIAETKTRIDRLVYIPERTRQLLQLWKIESIYTEANDFIFFGANRQRPINVTTVSKKLPKVIEKTGVERNGQNLVVHSFRHTFNTIMQKELPGT